LAMAAAMAVVTALIVFVVVRGPMRRLFGMNSRTNECSAFFVRTLFAILLLVDGEITKMHRLGNLAYRADRMPGV